MAIRASNWWISLRFHGIPATALGGVRTVYTLDEVDTIIPVFKRSVRGHVWFER